MAISIVIWAATEHPKPDSRTGTCPGGGSDDQLRHSWSGHSVKPLPVLGLGFDWRIAPRW